jgi:Tol biopolymer transport system component
MTTVVSKSALVLGLLLFLLIAAAQQVSNVQSHHILAYVTRRGIGLADTDYSLATLLLADPNISTSSGSIQWSPDGQQLAFVSLDRTGENPNYEIHVFSFSNKEIRDVSNSSLTNDSRPDWSPDGQLLAFSAQYAARDSAKSEIRVVDTHNWQIVPYLVQATGRDFNPFWSPDGKWLTFLSGRDGPARIYTAERSNGVLHSIVQNAYTGGFPVWSPDSRHIAFTRWEYPPERFFGSGEIYMIDVVSREEINLTHHFTDDSWPAWSPDGSHLLYLSDVDSKPEFYLMDVASRVAKRLTLLGSANYGYSLPARWSPDGRWLALSLTTNEGTNIYNFDFSTENLYRVTNDSYDVNPAWQP